MLATAFGYTVSTKPKSALNWLANLTLDPDVLKESPPSVVTSYVVRSVVGHMVDALGPSTGLVTASRSCIADETDSPSLLTN